MLLSDEKLVMVLGSQASGVRENIQRIQEKEETFRVEIVTIKNVDNVTGNLHPSRYNHGIFAV